MCQLNVTCWRNSPTLLLNPPLPQPARHLPMEEADTPVEAQAPVEAHPDDGLVAVMDHNLTAPGAVSPLLDSPGEAEDAIPTATHK
jgi:hypothetical protein